jgi:hypothetical protein
MLHDSVGQALSGAPIEGRSNGDNVARDAGIDGQSRRYRAADYDCDLTSYIYRRHLADDVVVVKLHVDNESARCAIGRHPSSADVLTSQDYWAEN